MLVKRVLLLAILATLSSGSVQAASFDCDKASTPFEHAICDTPDLSAADELLAKSFATAIGGLTETALGRMRDDQRNWLGYAQRACTADAQPLTSGGYDETGAMCLVGLFNDRSDVLEQSRMISGHRFYIESEYDALPDPAEADNPDSYWKLAKHEKAFPLLDSDDPFAENFNAWSGQHAKAVSATMAELDGEAAPDDTSDTDVRISVKEIAGASRITLAVSTYWFGHGAAHGNPSVGYLHYLVAEDRDLVASDVFDGKNWERKLLDIAWSELQAEHGEWLQVNSASEISEIVIDPARWDFTDQRALTIQFQPYEVSAYAYGAPTITISWDKLDGIMAETIDQIRYGW